MQDNISRFLHLDYKKKTIWANIFAFVVRFRQSSAVLPVSNLPPLQCRGRLEMTRRKEFTPQSTWMDPSPCYNFYCICVTLYSGSWQYIVKRLGFCCLKSYFILVGKGSVSSVKSQGRKETPLCLWVFLNCC